MSLCALNVKDEREAAQGPLREATDARIELIHHPEDEEGQFKEKAFRHGLDWLKCAFGQYKAGHFERHWTVTRRGDDYDSEIESSSCASS